MTKKKTEKEPILCSHDGEDMELCKDMKLCVREYGIPVGRQKIPPGLYIAGNMMNTASGIGYNRGPAIYGHNNKGVYLTACPFCLSDLVENWHKPVAASVKLKIEAHTLAAAAQAQVRAKKAKRSKKRAA